MHSLATNASANSAPAEFLMMEQSALRRCELSAGGQAGVDTAQRLLDLVKTSDLSALFAQFGLDALARVLQSRSYWHPGGFIRSQLFRSDRSLPEIRLHHWKARKDGGHFDEAIHEHPWDAISIVLEGAVRNEFWSVSEGSGWSMTLFETKDEASARYVRIGACSAEQKSQFDVHKYQYYWIPSGVFHRTRLISPQAITLLIRGPFLRLFSLIADVNEPSQYSRVENTVDLHDSIYTLSALRRFCDAQATDITRAA